MASGMAHELSQPLAALATFSHAGQRMLDRPEPMVSSAMDVFRQMSDEALKAGHRLQAIRRVFERERDAPARCQIRELVMEIAPVLQRMARPSQVHVHIDASADVPHVHVERLKIQHVLMALTCNAIEASAGVVGERDVHIRTSADRHHVETAVIDSGPGVAPELKDKVFRPFFSTKPRGTGLGLASSRAIIELYEGTMGYDNVASGGCRFWFRLPIDAT